MLLTCFRYKRNRSLLHIEIDWAANNFGHLICRAYAEAQETQTAQLLSWLKIEQISQAWEPPKVLQLFLPFRKKIEGPLKSNRLRLRSWKTLKGQDPSVQPSKAEEEEYDENLHLKSCGESMRMCHNVAMAIITTTKNKITHLGEKSNKNHKLWTKYNKSCIIKYINRCRIENWMRKS